MRPANVVTAVADILAGIAISSYLLAGQFHWQLIALLCLSTAGLYAGGVVLNDLFDAKLDAIERPERPIPSGLISKSEAAALGSTLLLAGVLLAGGVSWYPAGLIALIIAIASVVYDKWGKHHSFLGPLNMGLCRGLNLLLGMSILPEALSRFWWLSVVPIVYIAAITMISRGEVHGGSKKTLNTAAVFYLLVIMTIFGVSLNNGHFYLALVFLLVFAAMIFPPLLRAISEPVGKNIGKAVKSGVIALILMNAAWASAFGSVQFAITIALLLPVSLGLAKLFAVT